jgi:hypothetical protein
MTMSGLTPIRTATRGFFRCGTRGATELGVMCHIRMAKDTAVRQNENLCGEMTATIKRRCGQRPETTYGLGQIYHGNGFTEDRHTNGGDQGRQPGCCAATR